MAQNNEIQGRLTTGELKMASWWVKNRPLVRRLGYGSLIALCILLWGYALWGLLDAVAISYPTESRIPRDIALNQQRLASLESDRPQDVSLSDVSVFSTTDNRFDMAVELTNPNPMWWAEFDYKFSLSGEETPFRSGYVLPNSTQILTELGYKPKSAGGSSASLVIENVRWHRVDPAFVGASYDEFSKKRFAIEADNVTYDTNIVLGTRAVGQTSFTLANKSSYGFWSVDLVVRLSRGPSVVAVNKITISNLQPGEKRPIQLVWLDNLPGITKTEVIPQVNLLDPKAYLPTTQFK